MRDKYLPLTLLLILINFFCYGPQSAEAAAEKPAVVINQLELTQEELKQELSATPSPLHEAEVPAGSEPDWLSRIIERELLVQEAQRRGLDRELDFIRTLERFWKEALIKLLLDRKAQEIGDQIHIYEPEIEAYYEKLQEETPGEPLLPLSDLKDEIQRTLRQEKQAEALDAWITGLREKAKVVIDHEAVSQLR